MGLTLGRIAVYYGANTFPVAKMVPCGGNVGRVSAAGTIYLKDNAQSKGEVIISNVGFSTTLDTPLRTALASFRGLTCAQSSLVHIDTQFVIENLSVLQSGILSLRAPVAIESTLLVSQGGKIER